MKADFGNLGSRQVTDVSVIDRRIRPVGLNRHDVEAVTVDQHLRDARSGLVELRGAVGRLAEQDHTAVAEPLDEIAQLVQIAEGLGGFRHEPADAIVDSKRTLCREEKPRGKARTARHQLALP